LNDAETGANIEFEALAVSDGAELKVGTPVVEGAKVVVSVVDEHLRGKKIFSFKKKRRKGYRRKIGHRQELTRIKVESISA
jgi:large subunit ribosomal protein L21